MLITLLWTDVSLMFFKIILDAIVPKNTPIGTLSSIVWPSIQSRQQLSLLLECGLAGSFFLILLVIPTLLPSINDAIRRKRNESKDGKDGSEDGSEDGSKDEKKKKVVVRSANACTFYSILLIGIGIVLLCTFYMMQKTFPLTYLFNYIQSNSNHMYYLIYWCVILVIGIAYIGTPSTSAIVNQSVPQIIHRKLFHLLALLLFVPPILNENVDFLGLSIGIALALSFIIEVIRIGRVKPCGAMIHEYIQQQVDNRDQGVMVLTHIYLLSGCGITMWMSPSLAKGTHEEDTMKSMNILFHSAGILATGIGDAMGAAVGAGWGSTRHVIHGTSKSIEGSLAMFVSIILASCILCINHDITVVLQLRVIASFFICTIIEACTTTIDNLVLPLVLLTCLVLSGGVRQN
jgi:dolichol kinase